MKQNQVRIIAGIWRSRKIIFADAEGLRPTPDRVKETVFNWLTPHIVGSRCLDLFAGSGALGFEALSRGAEYVVSIDQNAEVITNIQKNAETFKTNAIQIVHHNSLSWLQDPKNALHPFDSVFVDPPYRLKVLVECFKLLEKNGFLKPNALIQFESETPILSEDLPKTWKFLHQKKAGVVHYYLAEKGSDPDK